MRYHVCQFAVKTDNFDLFDPNLPKKQIRIWNWRISILEILCVPIFRQNGQLWICGLKFAQKWILRSKFQKSKSGFRMCTSNIPRVRIFSQNEQLLIFRPKFGEIACVEVDLDGTGWRWVHGLVIPLIEYSVKFYLFSKKHKNHIWTFTGSMVWSYT